MLVALTALVSSLAGPAAADQVARIAQSITSTEQIKNGIITSADIKNETINTTDVLNGGLTTEDIGTGQVTAADIADDAVRGDKVAGGTLDGSDVKDNSLTGEDVNEGSLGTVPSANSANNAGTVDGFDADDFAPADAIDKSGLIVLTPDGPTVDIVKRGPFTLQARCEFVDNSNPNRGRPSGHQVFVYIATTEADSAGARATNSILDDLDPDDPEDDRQIWDQDPQEYGGTLSWSALSPSGKTAEGTFSIVTDLTGRDCAVHASAW
jgi:hypothetical protein